MEKDYFDELLRRYEEHKLTAEERQILDDWLESIEYPSSEVGWTTLERAKIKVALMQCLPLRKTIPLWKKVAVAASLIAVLGMGYLFYNRHQPQPNEPIVANTVEMKEDESVVWTGLSKIKNMSWRNAN